MQYALWRSNNTIIMIRLAVSLAATLVAIFVAWQLLVISPLLLLLWTIGRAAAYVAPDMFASEPRPSMKRRILLCVDSTSFSSVNWATRDFILRDADRVIVAHVVESTDPPFAVNPPVSFDRTDIDAKMDAIPQYMAEFCHWLARNEICYEGLIVCPERGSSVAETILRLARAGNVDCIIASASERAGT